VDSRKTFFLNSLLWLLIYFFLSCQSNESGLADIAKEVAALTSQEKQILFLENIYAEDQAARQNNTAVQKQFGYHSEEHLVSLSKMNEIDELNLQKIEAYLKTYGHPKIDVHGYKACEAPWLVVHHHHDGISPRRRNFHYIYRATLDGDLENRALIFYLNRMYDIKFGQRIEWTRPYREEEELDTLIKSLDLIEIKKSVDTEYTS